MPITLTENERSDLVRFLCFVSRTQAHRNRLDVMMLFRREYTDDERRRAEENLDWAEEDEDATSYITPESFGGTLHFKNIIDYVRSETKGTERLDVPHLRGLVRLYLEGHT